MYMREFLFIYMYEYIFFSKHSLQMQTTPDDVL